MGSWTNVANLHSTSSATPDWRSRAGDKSLRLRQVERLARSPDTVQLRAAIVLHQQGEADAVRARGHVNQMDLKVQQ
jgi:hypothetical protein